MMTSSRQGLRVNFNNKVIDSIKSTDVSEPDYNFVEEPILEFCTINSSGPKTDPSLKIKVHLSKIATEDIVVDFNISGSSAKEKFSFGDGILNIEAGLKSAIIIIEGIPHDRFGFAQGDKKIIVSLLESSNSLLGSNMVYTHTLTDDLKEWTDPNANYFCTSEFNNPKSATSLVDNPQNYDQNTEFADTNLDIQNSNMYNDREEADTSQDTEQLKSTVKEWALDPVKVTASGCLLYTSPSPRD